MTQDKPEGVACIVIASAKRSQLLDEQVLPSVLAADFAEVAVVGDFHPGRGYRYLHVPPLTQTTTDALVKRDVGTLATTAPWVFYLSDDHAVRRSRQVGAARKLWRQWRE